MGFILRNMSIKSQVKEILKVKKSESSIIRNPVTTTPDQQISQVKRLMKKHKISGVPVVIDDGTLAGIVTNRDLRFETDVEKKVSEVMTKNGLVIISEAKEHRQMNRPLHIVFWTYFSPCATFCRRLFLYDGLISNLDNKAANVINIPTA